MKLTPKTKKKVGDLLEEHGYESEEDFIEDALMHRILGFRRIDFLHKVAEIQKTMKRRNVGEEDILKDFDKLYHKK